MPDVADRNLRQIVGRSLITASTFAASIRDFIVSFFRETKPLSGWMMPLREQLSGMFTTMRDHLHYTNVISWVYGYDWAEGKTSGLILPSQINSIAPPPLLPPLGFDWNEKKPPIFTPRPVESPEPQPAERPRRTSTPPGRPPLDPPPAMPSFAEGPEELRFPKIEEAAKRLTERGAMRRDEFDAASEQARRDAFTIAGDMERGTIETVRDTLADDLREGTSLDGFADRLKQRMGGSPIGDAHLETVYRTNVQSAFRDGRETLMQNPVVAATFPYQEYVHIGDDRVRHEHAMLSNLGLDGTGVYRRDDPFWDKFTPPWDYNCRCGINVLTIEAAARKGVKEAKQWLETGESPAFPEWRLDDIPFAPNPGFGSRGKVALV